MQDTRHLPRLLTADEVAEQTGVPRYTLYELVKAGELPAVKFGRRIRFDPGAVRRWMEEGGTGGNGDG